MYIERLSLRDIRTFKKATIEFLHPDRHFSEDRAAAGMPRPRLPNVNLLLGANASGKTTLLQAAALSAFGPAAGIAGLPFRDLVRFSPRPRPDPTGEIGASLVLHEQDGATVCRAEPRLRISRKGELEDAEFVAPPEPPLWDPVYESDNAAFFVVAYGATRRVEPGENLDMGARTKSRFQRAQRVQCVFQDSHALIPLTYGLPELKHSSPKRYEEVAELIDQLLGRGHFRFTGDMDRGDYLFERSGTRVPFQGLSDGYRAFIGWVADLLYHVRAACPSDMALADVRGVVLVDEIDLHLHPKWQMKVAGTVAKALPRMQFIFTSHSPLVAGSLEWTNIICLKLGAGNRTSVKRLEESIHGLDADQILCSDLFGLTTTRAATKVGQLAALTRRARAGDDEAAKELIAELARGSEDTR